jgi:hypothetical protein
MMARSTTLQRKAGAGGAGGGAEGRKIYSFLLKQAAAMR